MSRLLSALLHGAMVAAIVSLPQSAAALQAADPKSGRAAPVFEVVKTGDRAMTCAALTSEINALAATEYVAPVEPPKKKKKKSGFGVLKVLGAAAPMLGGFGGVSGAVTSSALTAAGSAAYQSPQAGVATARAATNSPMAGPSPQTQRKTRLLAIFESKRC